MRHDYYQNNKFTFLKNFTYPTLKKNGITKHILLTFETKTLRFGTADICGGWGWKWGPCLSNTFCSIPNLYLLHADSIHTHACDNKKCFQVVPKVPRKKKSPFSPLGITGLKEQGPTAFQLPSLRMQYIPVRYKLHL